MRGVWGVRGVWADLLVLWAQGHRLLEVDEAGPIVAQTEVRHSSGEQRNRGEDREGRGIEERMEK